MPSCTNCGEALKRAHRKPWEKSVYSIVFRCGKCGRRMGEKHPIYNYLARHTRCPRCGTPDVDRRTVRDKIDKVTHSPVSMFQMLLGGSLYHCGFCRIQFYDLRGRAKS